MADVKYSVVLKTVGNQPLKTTKVLCGALGLGLAKAKSMVDNAPITVASEIDAAIALDLKKQLEEIGNTVFIPGLIIESKPTVFVTCTASSKTAVSADDAFDAIFGDGAAKKATAPAKATKTAPKATASGVAENTDPKMTAKKKTAADNDDFDIIFGSPASKKETEK